MNFTSATTTKTQDIQTESLDVFLASIEKRAYRIAYVSLSDRDEALDAVQDSMMNMFQKYAHKPSEQWRPLFYRILSNRITDTHRSNQVRKRLQMWFTLGKKDNDSDDHDPDPLDHIASLSGEQPLHQLQSDDSISVLDDALSALPLRQQQAFLLRMWEGMSTEETAKAMGCSGGSVKTHLSRALATLKPSLQPHYEHYE